MKKEYIPNERIESFDRLNIQRLKEKGIKAVLLDIDNTLVGYKCMEPTARVKEWINGLKSRGFKVAIVTNASKKRTERFCRGLDVFYVYRASKPGGKGLTKALAALDIKPEQAAFLGDQIFTDIYGANRLGMYSVLVRQISRQEILYCKWKRLFEKRIIRKLNEQDPSFSLIKDGEGEDG